MNKFYVFFVITLICTLPVHHAHALSVKVTGNSGSAGVNEFLNGNGDVWELTASLTNLEYAPSPSQVFLEMGSAGTEFTSCSGDGTAAECKFISDLSDGIEEGSYSFKVAVYDAEVINNETVISDTELGSDTENVYVDSDSPIVSFLSATQDGQDIMLDFVAYEPNTCSGLKKIEVYDNDGGEILDSITFDEPGSCEYDYETGNRAGQLPAELSDQGSTELRVRATDFMGLQGVSNIVYFTRDFVLPVAETLSFPGTESIGELEIILDEVQVNITECSGLTEVLSVSEQINFQGIPANLDYKGDCHYEATWNDLSFTPSGETVTITVVMQDQYENIGEDILSYTFDRDITNPEIDFFGTSAVFEDVSYMADGATTDIVARIIEAGSGIEPELVIASFSGLGIAGYLSADYCLNETSEYTCVWENIHADGEGTRTEEIRLIQVMDVAGNDYGTYTVPLVIDNVGPTVLDFKVDAISEYGEFESFKSGDDIRIQLEVSESSGLQAKIGVHDLVMDAENTYDYGSDPYNEDLPHEDNGYALFTQDDCMRNDDGNWECEFVIENIRTGYVSNADFNLLLYDTAGNFVEVWEDTPDNLNCDGGECDLEILAADYDTVPDLWEQRTAESDTYILLDISDATYPRQDFTVSLYGDSARLENQILQGCTAPDGAPEINRPILMGGLGDTSPLMTMIMELKPFDSSLIIPNKDGEFTSVEIEYNCTVLLFSSRNGVTYTNPEEQVLTIPVTFGFSEVGSLEEQVPLLINEKLDNGWFKTLSVINKIANVVSFIQKLYDTLKTLGSILNVFKIAQSTMTVATCNAEKAKTLGVDVSCPGAVTFCAALDQSMRPTSEFFNILSGVGGLFFCEAAPMTVKFSQPGDFERRWDEAKSNYEGSMTEATDRARANREASTNGDAPATASSDSSSPAAAAPAPADSSSPAAPADSASSSQGPISFAAAGEDAVGEQAQANSEGPEQNGEGAATAVSVIAAVRAWQTVVVTVWGLLKGQWVSNLIFMGGNKDELPTEDGGRQDYASGIYGNEQLLVGYVDSAQVNEIQRKSIDYEDQLRTVDLERRDAILDNNERGTPLQAYQQWLNAPVGNIADADVRAYLDGTGFCSTTGEGAIENPCTNSDILRGQHKINDDLESLRSWKSLMDRGVSASLYDNIYVSSLGLCIPGILYNLQKLYVVECSYISCLKNDVPAGLSTIDSCDSMRGYSYCKFWYGEVLGDILGFIGNLIDGIVDILVSIFTDPFSVIMIALNIACGNVGCQSIQVDQGFLLGVCQVYQVVGVANEVAQQVQGWIEWSKDNSEIINSCEDVESALSETVPETSIETSEGTTSESNTGTTTVSEVETSEVEQE